MGLGVIYVPRTGGDPVAAISKVIQQEFGTLAGVEEQSALLQTLSAVQKHTQHKKLLVILDQFEEFFISPRSSEARASFVREVGACYADAGLSVGFLLSLRKEFVDDLLDFKESVPQPLDARFSYRLRNWEPEEALSVLNAAAEHDQIPFAEALKEALVRDLDQVGEVRPVELQIVANRLIEQRIYELSRYREAEGAKGILKSYVKEVIEPGGDQTPEMERQIARHLLRSLCAEKADAKRPTGLRYEELSRRIKATLASQGHNDLIQNAEQYEGALQSVIKTCQSAYLIILEDEQTYNLIHDYIVRAILDATSEIVPIEEQANRLLDQYLEDQRRKPKTTIPSRHYRFIKKYASPQRKADTPAVLLLSRTRRLRALRVALVLSAIPLILTIAMPPKVEFRERDAFDVPHDDWVFSQDNRVAVSFKRNGTSSVWQLDQPWSSRIEIGVPFRQIRISPYAKYLAGITEDGRIYLWPTQDKLGKDAKPALTLVIPDKRETLVHRFWSGDWGGFSPDERWFFALSMDGQFYLWHPEELLPSTPEPYLSLEKAEEFYGLADVSFSPKSTYVTVADRDGSLYVSRLDQLSRKPAQPNSKISLNRLSAESVSFSRNEDWIAVTAEDSTVHLIDLRSFPNLVSKLALAPERREAFDLNYNIYFSPDSKWVIVITWHGSFYAWRVDETENPSRPPAIEIEDERGSYVIPGVDFSADGKWSAGLAENGATYVWQLEKSPSAKVDPAIPRDKGSEDIKFSPKGDRIAARSRDGGIYVWKPGEQPNLLEPTAYHDANARVSFKWCSDNAHLFTFGGSDVYWGQAGMKMNQVIRQKSPVRKLTMTPDRKKLIVFGRNHVSFMEQTFYVWGIPLYTYQWPELTVDDEDRE
jgi:WD40 repeat protein